jgi:transposase
MPFLTIIYLDSFESEGLFAMLVNNTYFLGCDVAKDKVDVSLINTNGIELWADKVANTHEDIATLLLAIINQQCSGDEENGDLTLCCVVESTSTYHQPMAEAAYAVGIGCRIYNPIITKQGIKATVRGKKTDRTDATMIARMGLRGEGQLYVPEVYKSVKYLSRSVHKMSVLNGLFRLHSSHVTGQLDEDLSPEAKIAMQGVQSAITTAKKQLHYDMTSSAKGDDKGDEFRLLQTIPGIGPFVASCILGEIQNIRRFHSSKALVAYAGLDPKIIQSGKALNSTGKITKRGSNYLRHSLFLAANVSRQFDPQFKELYDRKRAEGKTYKEANCAVARKLLLVVRSVWLNKSDYELPVQFVNVKCQ